MAVFTNLATNPRIGASLANYAGEGSAETPSVSAVASSPYPSVASMASVSASKANTYIGVWYTHAGLTPGAVYSFSGTMTSDSSVSGTYQMYVIWRNASGTQISTSTGTTVSWANGAFVRVKFENLTAPAGTASAVVIFRKNATLANGNVVRAGAVMINVGATALDYFDGATAATAVDSYGWASTVDASASQHAVTTAPTLTLQDNDVTGPRVVLLFNGVSLATATLNVYRTAEGRTMKVRGGVNLYAVGGATVLDPEVPFGIPVYYQAEQFDANGVSLGFTPRATITVDTTDCWATQPLSPGLAVQVQVRLGSTESLQRPSPGDIVFTEGATVGRTISGQRTGLQDASLVIGVGSAANATKFDQLWGDYGTDFPAVICLRTPPNVPLPAVLFFGCLAPERQSSGANRNIRYVLQGSETAPPAPGLVIPTLRRADIDAAFTTRAARATAYATRLARDADYTKAGLAG